MLKLIVSITTFYNTVLSKFLHKKNCLLKDLKKLEVSKNNFIEYQNNYTGKHSGNYSLNVEHNYFDDSTKLFSDLYLTKFLDTSIKSSFPCEDKNKKPESKLKKKKNLILKYQCLMYLDKIVCGAIPFIFRWDAKMSR